MNGGFTGIDFDQENKQDNTNNSTGFNPEGDLNSTAQYNTGNLTANLDNTSVYNTGNIDNTSYSTGNIDNTSMYNAGNLTAENTTSIPLNNNIDSEVLGSTASMDLTEVSKAVTEENKNINPTLPNTRGIDSSSASLDIRMNPVTGEEMNVKDLIGNKEEDKVDNEEKLKTVEVEYKPPGTFSTFLLIVFFVFLIAFVVFLPELEQSFSDYLDKKNGGPIVREITTGKLVCTLKTNTANLDKNYERIFNYENNKLKSSKLTTITRGDASLDEDTLTKLSDQCKEIKEGVEKLDGIQISCKLDADKLEEVEVFDYSKYDIDQVSQVYLDNGSSVLDLEEDADINIVMTTMRQSGYTCEKQK